MSDLPPAPPPDPHPAPARRSAKDRVLGLRATGGDGRLSIWYPAWVPGLWAGITAVGLLFGFAAGGPDGDAQAGVIGIGFALIGLFVTWFVARPVVMMDRTGVRLCPAFGSRTSFRWSEIASLGVASARRGRTRGIAFTVVGPNDEEASVDGAWLGLTAPALHRIDVTVRHFARSIGVTGPAVEEIVLDADEDARYH